jgi:hypothetical protein
VESARSQQQTKEIVMNPIKHLRRLAAVVAGLAAALLAFATPAFATLRPPGPGEPVPPPVHVHTVVVGGMPGWQIALIAIGAALAAATLTALADRARAARRHPVTAAA